MYRFGLIGVGGYIAPRHLQAIKATGNDLVVAMDVNDSVGVLDSHFPSAEFFNEFEEFEAFVEDEKLRGQKLDYISICSPNHLHVAHMKFALRNGVHAVCEKPLVLASSDLAVLKNYEITYGAAVNSILQLRLHPSILELRDKIWASKNKKKFDVKLTYMTSRGKWYMRSWKGSEDKSGGVITNIGIHFFDMLSFIFGPVQNNEVHFRDKKTSAGYLEYERARVSWFLSIDSSYLPSNAVKGEKLTYRSITINGEELEFSGGFTDLHTQSYERILSGRGFGLEANKSAIETVEKIRTSEVVGPGKECHPLLFKVNSKYDISST